uniref:Sodium/potassium-transporting ATPase subunit beta n=1 Tax=Bursaphelenchus xylophilus TaxID=6326 RepID=A0A1I7SLE1_BURXY
MAETERYLMNGRAKKPEQNNFSSFIYNKNEGTCLGRTAKSWCQITIFYIIFYAILAAFWIGCLYIFLSTTDPQLPRFYGKGTIIGANPGVGYQPWLKEDPESTLIKFNPKDPKTYKRYVEVLDKYFAKYENDNNTRVCSGSESNSDIIKDGKVVDANMQPCRFDLSPFQKAGCLKSNDYGFKTGTPCVVLSLNRLIGWVPEDFAAGDVPKEVSKRYRAKNIAFHCAGTHKHDQEHEGPIEYVPPEGIDGRFYPYAVMDNYQQPITVVKFKKLPLNRLVMIECKAYAKNIERDRISGLGVVNFELFKVDDAAKKEKEL